jgi:putative ABC transport system permease protein
MNGLLRDVRHALRVLGKTPGWTFPVILTLALGIGANAAIFSVVDQLLIRPLPYPNGDELVMVYENFQGTSTNLGGNRNVVSPANWLDWQRENRTLQGLAAWFTVPGGLTLTGVGEPARLHVQAVSSEFFPLLGVAPLIGRTVTDEDDRPNAPAVVVLSYQLWQRRFGGDRQVVGRMIQLNDQPAQVIGVMPASFRFISPDNDLWGAFRLNRSQPWRDTAGRFMKVVARLKPGVTMAAARADLDAIAAQLAATYPFNKGTGVTLVSLREELTGQVQMALLILYAAVGVLLSIACFNVANLLLARASAREREMAIRASLGAGRLMIVRQLVVESVLLALMGGTLGVLLAYSSIDGLIALAPPDLLRAPDLAIDRRVLLYVAGLSAVTGVVVGIVPGVLTARHSMMTSLRISGSRVTQSPRVRQALVVFQVGMTVVLLSGAGLLVRTVIALGQTNNGFDKKDVLTMEVTVPGARYNTERRVAFYRDVAGAIRALPGVESVAAANSLAVVGEPRGGTVFHRLGTPQVPMNERPVAQIRVVTPGYFRALRIPVLMGREFTEADDANPTPGFIVNETFAKTYLPGVSPLSVSLTVWMQNKNPYAPIIGVVGDVSEWSLRGSAQPTVFYSHRQMPETVMTLFVRAPQPTALTGPVVAAIHRFDPNVAVTKIRTYEDALADSVARERLSALVAGGFALSGLLLASLGLYGLLAFVVAERTKEIGVRIALGAHLGQLTWSVVNGGLRLALVGIALGLGASLLLLRALTSILFSVEPNDFSTHAIVVVLLCAIAALASYLPARRAARVDPLVALRYE